MKRTVVYSIFIFGLSLVLLVPAASGAERTSPLIIDHLCTDLSEIPAEWIDSVKANCKLHYAHTSHGGQLTTGIDRIENSEPFYDYAIDDFCLPDVSGAFCIFDGQEPEAYILPDLYWKTKSGMDLTRDVLNHNPEIEYSMWAWCGQPADYSAEQMQAYLDSITALENEFPEVTFIYMTGHAQHGDGNGWNRSQNNNLIRDYCNANNKVLFDFGDIDCWWYNPSPPGWEFNYYIYDSDTVPVEHSQYGIDQANHTSYENCEHKGIALWWAMACLAGWDSSTMVEEKGAPMPEEISLKISPNPFNSSCRIEAANRQLSITRVEIFDLRGNVVFNHPHSLSSPDQNRDSQANFSPSLTRREMSRFKSGQRVVWRPDKSIASGVYLIRASLNGQKITQRIMYLK